MSVLVLDPKVYQAVFVKAVSYTFNRTCDINYCSTFEHLTEEQIKQIITIWCDLNEESFDKKYKEEPSKHKLSEFIPFKFKGKTISTYQMLKYLECISYNIELETIKRYLTNDEKFAMETLEKSIKEIMGVIIGQIPEYKNAKWSDYE